MPGTRLCDWAASGKVWAKYALSLGDVSGLVRGRVLSAS